MSDWSFKSSSMVLPFRGFALGSGAFGKASMFTLFLILSQMSFQTPCHGGQESPLSPPGKTSSADTIPQWSWDWADDLKKGASNLVPVPVTLNPQSSFRSPAHENSSARFSKKSLEGQGLRSLFTIPEDGESELDMFDQTDGDSARDFAGMTPDAPSSSLLTLGSRLVFHVSKRFLPYLGGGIIYGGRDSSCPNPGIHPRTTGYELGLGFTFSGAPIRFGVDMLYRGMVLTQEERSIALRKDETCPNSYDKDGYSMSIGFTCHF